MTEPMFTLCGQVANVFVQPAGTSKKTGEEYEAKAKVQILGQIPMPNGGHRVDLVTLGVDDSAQFKSLIGQRIRVSIGVYASGRSVGYFLPKGAVPQVATTRNP